MAELQLALDGDLSSGLEILSCVHRFIDIVEVGTPLVIREGMHAVRRIRAEHPNLKLVADLKIMDAGELEANIAFDAGADRVTVMALAGDATVRGAVIAAEARGKSVMADMMGLAEPEDRARELARLGCDTLCLHTSHELQQAQGSPTGQLARARAALPHADLAIAGGVRIPALDYILPLEPQVIIVGSAITGAEDPGSVAKQFHRRIRAHGNARLD